jgi:hypothetical protein
MLWSTDALILGYGVVLLAIVAISATIGARWGWVKEMLTAVGGLFSVLILFRPESAHALFVFGQSIVRLVRVLVTGGALLDLEKMAELSRQYKSAPLLNEGNAGIFFFAVFALVVLLTRLTSSRLLVNSNPGAQGQLLGLLMGALNGFIFALVLDAFLVPRIRGLLTDGITISVDWTLSEGNTLMGDYIVTLFGVFLAVLVIVLLFGRRLLPRGGNSGRKSSS